MIFDRADREELFRTEVRKACESAMVSANDSLSPAKKQIIANQLAMDVNRCHAMVRLADNDLSSIREDASLFDSEPLHLPLDIFEDYLAMMKPDDRECEGYYTFLVTYMIGYLQHIRFGIRVADEIIGGKNPVSEADTVRLLRIRTLFESLYERCNELMEEDSELPYDTAMEYIECNLEECSIILRIASGKDIVLDEMSFHIDWAETINMEPFNQLFLVDMDPSDRQMYDEYNNRWAERVGIIIGRCIADQEVGCPCR